MLASSDVGGCFGLTTLSEALPHIHSKVRMQTLREGMAYALCLDERSLSW